jgi:hypothetical protein
LPNIVIISSMAPPPPDGYTKKRQRYDAYSHTAAMSFPRIWENL